MNRYIVQDNYKLHPVVAPDKNMAMITLKRKFKIPIGAYLPLNVRKPKTHSDEGILFNNVKNVAIYKNPNEKWGYLANQRGEWNLLKNNGKGGYDIIPRKIAKEKKTKTQTYSRQQRKLLLIGEFTRH